MFGFFQELRGRNVLSAGVTVILGLLLILAPGGVISTILKVVGWGVLIVGVLMVLSCGSRGHVTDRRVSDSVVLGIAGVILFLLGLWIVRNPGNIVSIAVTIAGVLMLLHAINDIRFAVSAYRVQAVGWWSAALSGGVTLILALMILLNPFGTALSVIRIAGVCLLIDGAGDLLMANRMRDFF